MRRTRWMSPGLAVIMALVLVGLTWGGVAGGVSAAEFTQAELFVELNDTDGDLGLHGAIDGGPYVALEIEDPGGRTILGRSGRRHLFRDLVAVHGDGAVAEEVPVSPCAAEASKSRFIDAVRG